MFSLGAGRVPLVNPPSLTPSFPFQHRRRSFTGLDILTSLVEWNKLRSEKAQRLESTGPTDYFMSSRITIEMPTTAAVFQSKTMVMYQ
jgi:hypothetical protein